MDTKPLESLSYEAPNPNKPIVVVGQMEGLAEQLSEKIHSLSQIKDLPIESGIAIANAWSRLDSLRTKEIHNLRKIFE